MRLKNGEVCLGWPLSQHILTQGWYYNDGSLHQAIDMRAIVGHRLWRRKGDVPDYNFSLALHGVGTL